jgi:hypothetical protein
MVQIIDVFFLFYYFIKLFWSIVFVLSSLPDGNKKRTEHFTADIQHQYL